MIVTIRYFLKSIKSVFVLVQCNTSLSKNYVAHSYVCVVEFKKKNSFVCAVCAYEFSHRTRIFPQIRIRQKVLQTFVELWSWWKRSKFEHCGIEFELCHCKTARPSVTFVRLQICWISSKLERQIQIRTLSHLYRLVLKIRSRTEPVAVTRLLHRVTVKPSTLPTSSIVLCTLYCLYVC